MQIRPGPVARSDAHPPGMRPVASSILGSGNILHFVEIGHEIISTAILSLLLIQVGQLSVAGKRMCN